MYSREIMNMFYISQVSGLVKNVNVRIYSETVNVKHVKLCQLILIIKLYLFILPSVTLTVFQDHSNFEQL